MTNSLRLSGGWQVATALAVVFAASRAVGVLGPNGLRWLLPLGFTLMALAPFLLLDANGRRAIGFVRPANPRIFASAVLAGAAAAIACFALGYTLFGTTADNWFVTIANSYRQVMDTTDWSIGRLHLVFTIPALIFSPIGEEIFFRGYLQYAIERRFSARVSTIAECAAFGTVHVCHHGLILAAGGILLRPVSAPIWISLMFGAALLFAYLRKSSGSLLPAIAAHAAFNLVMNLTIFAFLWKT
ncbi:MAG TPA: CPBP family intramembrane glutamic endopeptidase [Steroidobacteraceae bacterium]|jgi:membrane protease YdiL (CAAX protease family)|nr:CPBP family intramembrane glutamic endopeptidase [Steroidobacteraceae bacterium]